MGKPISVFPKKRIAVLGGGCAGLAAALRLIKKDYEVFIFEQNSQLGGICGGRSGYFLWFTYRNQEL